jgi:hypothetical protein
LKEAVINKLYKKKKPNAIKILFKSFSKRRESVQEAVGQP